MKFRSFRPNFPDGNLASFTLGPRQELALEIALNPVWNKEKPSSVSVRFGGIENYDEVASLFRAVPHPPRPDIYIAEVIGLQYVREKPNSVLVDLVDYGHISIHSRNVTESY